ncbi:unnamed protein product, partial [Pylaiella littoralis]
MSSTAAASNTEQDSSSKSTSSGSTLPHPTDFYSSEKYRGRKFATERLQLNVALDWGRCGGTKTDTTSSLERISANSSAQTELQQHSVLLGTAPVRLQHHLCVITKLVGARRTPYSMDADRLLLSALYSSEGNARGVRNALEAGARANGLSDEPLSPLMIA